MKKIIFYLALSLAGSLYSGKAYGQEAPKDSITSSSPYYLKTQFAGSIGLLSVGVGRQSFNSRLETDISLGYLPKKVGGDDIFTVAIKSTFLPYRSVKWKAIDWKPITFGAQVGYTFGDEYFASERYLSRYPNSYYRFSTALNIYVFAGGQIKLNGIEKARKFAGYYEVGTMGEYLISYITNPKYLSPGKIFNLALGVKMYL